MKIALIDDKLTLKSSPRFANVYRYEIVNGIIKRASSNKGEKSTHATLCYDILNQNLTYAERHELLHIDIAKNNELNINDFLIALKFLCVQNIDILCLSIGTTIFSHANKIYDAIKEIIANGTLIIAANSNNNLCTFPAFFSEVIGVISLPKLYFEYNVFYGIPSNDLNVNIGMVQKYQNGNSFIAPQVLVYLINQMDNISDHLLSKDLQMIFMKNVKKLSGNKKEIIRKLLTPKLQTDIFIIVILYKPNFYTFVEKVMEELSITYYYESSCIIDCLEESYRGFRFILFNKNEIEEQIQNHFHRDIDLLFLFMKDVDVNFLSQLIKPYKFFTTNIREESVQMFCSRVLNSMEISKELRDFISVENN